MKTKKNLKKLVLKKVTISNLAMSKTKGGANNHLSVLGSCTCGLC